MQNFLPALKAHILERLSNHSQSTLATTVTPTGYQSQTILFKNDRLYVHNMFRINYTAYDVRRLQDTVNPSTSHNNVMVLNANATGCSTTDAVTFAYARILGVYHANVICTGPGMIDYQPRRVEFLWVRWYKTESHAENTWSSRALDHINFPPVTSADAFGFVDPNCILRACHVIPVFCKGQKHSDGRGLSKCGGDSSDYIQYYINRSVPPFIISSLSFV